MVERALTVRHEAGLIQVLLGRPPRNELGFDFFEELAAFLADLVAQPSALGVVISGRGRHFSAGSNIDELFQRLVTDEQVCHWREHHVDLLGRLSRLPIPVVAAVGGVCLGSALELALACHYRVAADNALLGLPEAQHGLLPGCGGTQRLPRLIGHSRALEMILSGEPVDAGRAAHWGLVDIVVPRKELMSRARDLVLRLTNDTHRAGLRQKGVRCASC